VQDLGGVMLTENELIRYGRQILHPAFGEEGQKRLKNSHVVVAGLGGLGCAASIYLACAGVGQLTIVDRDSVELSNLNRQVLYCDEDIGKHKTSAAAQKLAKLNPSVELVPMYEKISPENVQRIIRGADAVLDGMDNFEGRLALNFGCVAECIPFVHGGVSGLNGEVTTIIPGETPCFSCIFPTPPQEREIIPVFGVTPAIIATLQVMEAIKLLSGFGNSLAGRMLYINGTAMSFRICALSVDPACRVCGPDKTTWQATMGPR
jgi:molybdopterin/thiamine biosynthesis adenylyltransferase